MAELPDKLHNELKKLCSEGDELAERRSFSEALEKSWAAWDLLPEPRTEREAATWILAAIGDANFLSADFVGGRDNLSAAMHCPGAMAIRLSIFDSDNANLSLATSIAQQMSHCEHTWHPEEIF